MHTLGSAGIDGDFQVLLLHVSKQGTSQALLPPGAWAAGLLLSCMGYGPGPALLTSPQRASARPTPDSSGLQPGMAGPAPRAGPPPSNTSPSSLAQLQAGVHTVVIALLQQRVSSARCSHRTKPREGVSARLSWALRHRWVAPVYQGGRGGSEALKHRPRSHSSSWLPPQPTSSH